ncbi:MAG: four-carbon acid sugar kinase family protein [Rhizobiales bacterium]|nr:four-carbon acid sugar kinase family protein [Hyphomicrobiales bacterium]
MRRSSVEGKTLLLGCVADDFTGATDLANVLTRGGMSCVQLNGLGALTDETAEHVAGADAVVVALKSRSIPAADAVAQSLQALAWLQGQDCRKFFFKYCSTFDSTDEGNIGPVAEAMMTALGAEFTIACPAAPENGRTVYQGHLFVNGVLLSETGMRNHPITPMTDANLVRVLGRQTVGDVGLIGAAHVHAGGQAVAQRIDELRAEGLHLAIADAIAEADLHTLAEGTARLPLITGGSGLAVGLPDLFRRSGQFVASQASLAWPQTGYGAVISGSCSQATNGQVAEMAKSNPVHALNPAKLAENADEEIEKAVAFVTSHRANGPALIYSTAPPDELAAVQARLGQDKASQLIEDAMGEIARQLVAGGVNRLVVAGGETSGAVVTALGLNTLAIGPEIDPGVPWTLSLGEPNLALALKSGNFGGPNFFAKAFDVLTQMAAGS